jgi:Holliday junction resolvase RusA-like endonuclease
MTSVVLHLSTIPPSVNGIWRSVGGRVLKSKDYREWSAAAAWEIKAQKPRKFLDDVALTIELRRPRANADLDNRLKACIDVLTGTVLADDRQVVDVRARWADIDGCRITVAEAADAQGRAA